MNLTKQEVAAFIGILLRKNPLVDINVDENNLVLKYFNGKTANIKIEADSVINQIIHNHENAEEQNWNEVIDNKLAIVLDEIKQYESVQKEPDRDFIEQIILDYCDKLTPNIIEETLDIDYQKIDDLISQQISLIREEISSLNITLQPELETPSIDLKEFKSFKNEMSFLFNDLKQTVSSEVETFKEQNAFSPVDYTYIEKLIDTKINNVEVSKEHIKHVLSIENVKGKVSVNYSDGSSTDFESLLAPIVRIIVAPLINSKVATVRTGAGGYGGGSPGLSAYDIAFRNGFIGTEQEWLASLSGGYVPPEDGTITYDVDGRISQIITLSNTTTINRDLSGVVTSIHKYNYTKQLIRDLSGKIIGWTIAFD